MQSPRFAGLLLLFLAIQLLPSCSSPTGNENVETNSANVSSSIPKVVPKDNVDEFTLLVNLPYMPEEVAWHEAPDHKSLTAVVRFSSADGARMAEELAKSGPGNPETIAVETWYPAELLAQAELSGESSIKGKSFTADAFLNPPYTKGKMTQIENTDYFIFQISA